MTSGLSSLNVSIIGGKVCRKNNKQKYIERGITSFIAGGKKKKLEGASLFYPCKVLTAETYHLFHIKLHH